MKMPDYIKKLLIALSEIDFNELIEILNNNQTDVEYDDLENNEIDET